MRFSKVQQGTARRMAVCLLLSAMVMATALPGNGDAPGGNGDAPGGNGDVTVQVDYQSELEIVSEGHKSRPKKHLKWCTTNSQEQSKHQEDPQHNPKTSSHETQGDNKTSCSRSHKKNAKVKKAGVKNAEIHLIGNGPFLAVDQKLT